MQSRHPTIEFGCRGAGCREKEAMCGSQATGGSFLIAVPRGLLLNDIRSCRNY